MPPVSGGPSGSCRRPVSAATVARSTSTGSPSVGTPSGGVPSHSARPPRSTSVAALRTPMNE